MIKSLVVTLVSLLGLIAAFTTPTVGVGDLHTQMLKSRSSHADTASVSLISGIRDIVDDYDVFLLDMWGVMHDGFTAYPGVLETIQKLKAAGKTLVILSNSSKRKDNSVKMLRKLGFDPDDFSQILTSGEVSFQLLNGDIPDNDNFLPVGVGKKVCILGSGDEDVAYCESAGWQVVPANEASLLLARGTFTVQDGVAEVHKRMDTEAYKLAVHEVFQTAAQRQLPMLVSNPDKVRPDFERPPMPGQIGDEYAALVANDKLVKRIGKPFPDVYDIALEGVKDRKRCVMVGDALETDIVGGNAAGVDTLWILKDGIHNQDLPKDRSLEDGWQQILDSFQNSSKTSYANGRTVIPGKIAAHFVW